MYDRFLGRHLVPRNVVGASGGRRGRGFGGYAPLHEPFTFKDIQPPISRSQVRTCRFVCRIVHAGPEGDCRVWRCEG